MGKRPPPIDIERKEPPLPTWANVLMVTALAAYSVLFGVLAVGALT